MDVFEKYPPRSRGVSDDVITLRADDWLHKCGVWVRKNSAPASLLFLALYIFTPFCMFLVQNDSLDVITNVLMQISNMKACTYLLLGRQDCSAR